MATPHASKAGLASVASLAIVWLAAICSASGQDLPPTDSRQPPTESPLQGPKVGDANRPSLVRRDFQGRFERVEGRPEEAALRRMLIDPDRRQQAVAVVDARIEALRQHLYDQVDLIKESSDASKGGDSAATQRLARQLYDRFEPDHPRDPLLAPLAAVLSPEEVGELGRLLDEYWAAWLDAEERSNAKAGRASIQARLQFELFRAELGDAYATTLRPFQQKLERLYLAVDPTPEQREAMRTAVVTYIKQVRHPPNEEARRKLAQAIYEALDEERRFKLVEAAISSL